MRKDAPSCGIVSQINYKRHKNILQDFISENIQKIFSLKRKIQTVTNTPNRLYDYRAFGAATESRTTNVGANRMDTGASCISFSKESSSIREANRPISTAEQ